ncbi:hypothetical protein [Streptomyces sp. NPDC056690]|uniref:hypothetical protein n=1 Tax=unclassified Streptomyces TaxID=2593676 RepID=UPI003629846A
MNHAMLRLRIEHHQRPRPGLYLTDTPAPDCDDCAGDGVIEWDYGDYETGEYSGTDWAYCTCWKPDRCRLILPLPRRPMPRRGPDPWATNEPPF